MLVELILQLGDGVPVLTVELCFHRIFLILSKGESEESEESRSNYHFDK